MPPGLCERGGVVDAAQSEPMTSKPEPAHLILSLPPTVPFVPPEALERGRGARFLARLGANESGFGPSPRVLEAMRAAASEMWMYPDPTNHDLKEALAALHRVHPDNIAVGEGIDGLLGEIVRIWTEPGAPVLTSRGAYPTFNYHVAAHGRHLVALPFRGDHEDWEGLAREAKEKAIGLVYFSNPNNPMGTWVEGEQVRRFLDLLPKTTMLILDEAYGETAPASALMPIEPDRPNVLRMRTFSKAYGLAGVRLGYAIGHRDAVAAFDKVRNHFGVNRMAQAAGLAAVADQTYLAETVARIAYAREEIARIAQANGLATVPSATNFIAVDCGGDGAFAARVLRALGEEGVFVRKPSVPGLDRCIRISTAPDAELAVLEAALPKALG